MKREQKFLVGSPLANARGMGLLSTLGGLAIAAVVAGVVSYSVYSTKFAAKSGSAADLCTDRASGILNSMISHSNKSVVQNWHPFPGDLTPPLNSSVTGQPRLPSGHAIAPMPSPGMAVNPQQTNMWALIESSYNWLGQIYNDPNAVSVCSMTGDGLNLTSLALGVLQGNGFRVNATPVLPNEQVFINLKRVNQTTGVVDCGRPLLLVPPSPANGAVGMFGIKVTVAVGWTGTDGQPRSCRRETTLQPDGDKEPPVIGQGGLLSNLTLNPAPGACDNAVAARSEYCRCPGGICVTAPCLPGDTGCMTMGGVADTNPLYQAFAPQQVRRTLADRYAPGSVSACARPATMTSNFSFAVSSSEPATLFSCGLGQTPLGAIPAGVANHTQCINFAMGAVTGNLTGRSIAQSQPTAVSFALQNLPVGTNRVSFEAIDHARNASSASVLVNVLDPCPASHTVQFCNAPAGTHPSICGEPNTCPGTRPPNCPNPLLTPCGQAIPNDSCGNPCGIGTGPAAPVNNPAIRGPHLDACNFCTRNGTCNDLIDPNGDGDNSDDVICPVGSCVGATVPMGCGASTATCPVFGFRPQGSPGPFTTGSYPQTGGVNEMTVSGLPGGCSASYQGHSGPVNTTANPTYSDTFQTAGPGNSTGERNFDISCGGQPTQTFTYRSVCSGSSCTFSCVQATCF